MADLKTTLDLVFNKDRSIFESESPIKPDYSSIFDEGHRRWKLEEAVIKFAENDRPHTNTPKHETRNEERDRIGLAECQKHPELKTASKAYISEYLQKHYRKLFTSGFPDWWKHQTIFPKGKPGRPRKTRE